METNLYTPYHKFFRGDRRRPHLDDKVHVDSCLRVLPWLTDQHYDLHLPPVHRQQAGVNIFLQKKAEKLAELLPLHNFA